MIPIILIIIDINFYLIYVQQFLHLEISNICKKFVLRGQINISNITGTQESVPSGGLDEFHFHTNGSQTGLLGEDYIQKDGYEINM